MRAPDTRSLLAALALWLACLGAHAGVADAPGDQLEVALVTYGPGAIYWERFGHDAIEIRDRASGEAVAFNYGMFDFSQQHFLLNFARGRMRYSMDAVQAAEDAAFYAGEGRSVRRQVLALTPAQANRLRDALLLNLQPENAPYDYDYFRANCATRVRDALDAALGGQLHAQWQAVPSTDTYRAQTRRLMAPQAWLMLLMDLGLGPGADAPLSLWQADFVPKTLADAISSAQVARQDGTRSQLQVSDTYLARARLPAPPDAAPDWRGRFLLLGLILGALLAVAGHGARSGAARWTFALTGSLFAVLSGLAGLVMVLLWFGTAHHAAWANQNLLLFSPLALALVPMLWRARRASAGVGRAAWIVALVLIVSAALALLGKPLLPHQVNMEWIALGLPTWCGLLLGLIRRPRLP